MKTTFITSLIALAGITTGAESYTWDFSTTGPYLSGTLDGNGNNYIVTETVTVHGVSTVAMTYSTRYWEKNTDILYNMLEKAAQGKSLVFTMDIFWNGSPSYAPCTFLHIGQRYCGITLGMSTEGQLSFSCLDDYEKDLVSNAFITPGKWQTVSFTLTGEQTSVTIDGNTHQGNPISWTDMSWEKAESDEIKYSYSLGCLAPGWHGEATLWDGVKIANLKAALIPEPATTSLTLAALGIVALRRRRR